MGLVAIGFSPLKINNSDKSPGSSDDLVVTKILNCFYEVSKIRISAHELQFEL